MKWVIEFSEEGQYARLTYEGLFSVDEQMKAMGEVILRDFWKPGMPLLIDHIKLEFGVTNIEMLKKSRDFHQKNDARFGSGRIAVVMKSITDFGRGRQFELLSEGKISSEIKIFRDEEKALEWLLG